MRLILLLGIVLYGLYRYQQGQKRYPIQSPREWTAEEILRRED